MNAAKKAVGFLKNNQVINHNDKNMHGGFYYQLCDKINGEKVKLNGGMYTWCTQFSLSAFLLLKSAQMKKNFDDLIKILF